MVRSLAVLLLLACVVTAAPKKPTLPIQYQHWLREEVTYIITDQEKKAFLSLETDGERDKFIEDFWDVRNPARGAANNTYKEEHYQRLQYVNETFGRRSNTPGWMTDMGRSWILFGKPVSQARFLGYGQLYPCELWFYQNSNSGPSIPGYFTLLFFMPEDIGEYRFYRPSLDTPLKLVRGSQFNQNSDVYKFLKPIAGDLAHAAFSLIPGDPIDTTNYTVDMTSDMLISRIQNFANDPFNVRRLRELRSLRIQVNSTFLVNQDQPLAIDTLLVADPIGQFWLDFSVPVRDRALGKISPDSKHLTLSSSFRLLTASGELIAEDEEERQYPAFAPDGSFTPFQVGGRLPLLPGEYKLEFRIVDKEKSRVFHGEKKIALPGPASTALYGPLLFSSADRVTQPDGAKPFQYFGVQFQPAINTALPRSEPLRLLFGLQVPASEVSDLTVEYFVAHAQQHESRVTLKDTISAKEFRDGRLLKSKTIPLTGLTPGPYSIAVTVRTATGAVLTAASIPARLGDELQPDPLYFLDSARTTSSPAGSSYIRALEAISWKDEPAAMRFMKLAVDANPENAIASRYLVEMWFKKQQFASVVSLYRQIGMKSFETSAESLTRISLSLARTGDRSAAQQILASARSLFPDSPLLLAASRAVSN